MRAGLCPVYPTSDQIPGKSAEYGSSALAPDSPSARSGWVLGCWTQSGPISTVVAIWWSKSADGKYFFLSFSPPFLSQYLSPYLSNKQTNHFLKDMLLNIKWHAFLTSTCVGKLTLASRHSANPSYCNSQGESLITHQEVALRNMAIFWGDSPEHWPGPRVT